MAALLEARHVTKIFGGGRFAKKQGTVALDDFSFRIDAEPPAITAVVGESGSGKTTLARLLLGLAAPTSGEVLYRGTDLRRLAGEERRRFLRDVQVIFQDPYEVYNPFYKVDHVLKTPIEKFHLAKTPAETRKLIDETLNAVGLRPDETLGRHPHQLSGGQRQRVMVARALLLQPRLIIADEPVSMVDASLRATILESLRQLHDRFGISILYITHDLTTAYQISDNILVMYRGEVAEAGEVDRVVKQPRHPYTQLLIQSIPQADPSKAWQSEGAIDDATAALAGMGGCKFADRCPAVMDVCRTTAPPLYRLDERRAAACFLYRDKPELDGTALDQVMALRSEALSAAHASTD
ncbi:MAG TPA: ABC transporter ATP-binding protein [Thermomicrobiales bacterium]|nr:ABC transporter ATP-binding protein [Thermomicrobiales bacterium]